MRAERNLRRRESRDWSSGQRRSEEHQDDRSRSEHKDHQVEDGEEHALAFVFFAALAVAIEDGDKGDGDSAAD